MLKRIGAEESGEFKAVASGTLPSGKPVVVNADGTVSVVVETSSSESLGSDVTFNAASTSWVANAFDSTNNKVVVAYSDGGNSSYGHARVGTVDSSDNSISFGTEVTFRSSASQYISACFDSANGKIVIAYQDQGDSFKGKAIVGTVSGTDISFGSSVEFQSGETTYINAVYDTSTSKVVIVYRNSSGTGKAIVGTVSGTSISFGSAVSTGHGALQGTAVYHAAASRIVAAGKVNNSTANAVVGAVSGTSISFGSAVAYGTSSAQKNNNKIGYDSASEKVVVFYRDEGDSSDGKASVGTVDSSDNSISFATAVTVTTDTVDMVGVQGFSSGGQIIFLYSDTDNTKGDLKVGTISGTTLSVGSELNVRNGGNTNYWGLCEDTTNDRIVIAYEGASSHGISNVYNPAFSITNLTSENYIGMLRGGAVADTKGATVDIIGAIADIPVINYVLSSASYDSVNFSVSGQDADPYGLFFRSDGAKMYVAGDAGNDINEYNLSTPWTVSSASYSQNFSVASQESAPNGVFFKTDGTKMFVVGTATDTVYEYALSSAWDISSASYGSVSFSVGSQDTVPTDLAFKTDGTKMFIVGNTGNNVYEYALSSAWVVSSASYTRSFSVASQETGPTGLFFSSDGLNMVVAGAAGVNKYVLSSAFDISSASYSQAFNVSSQENDPQALFFKSDGSKMYVLGSGSDTVYQYSTSVSLTPGQQYFVQTDGTIGTTAATPSVLAGTAISATELLVKT